MVSASARSKNTTASAASAPFLVAPKERTSTPAFQLASAGVQPSRATALAKRAPSMWTHRRRACAASAMLFTSAGVYTVLTSVAWVRLTARGGTSVGAGAGLVDRPGQVGGRDLAVHHRQRNRARVAPRPELGPAAFAAVDVSGVGHVDGPVGRGDDRRAEPVGGRPGAHGVDLDLGLEQLREALREPLGAGVGAVGRAVARIGGDERLQYLGGGAGHVVAVEVLLHAHAGLLGSTGLDDTTAGRGGLTIDEVAPADKPDASPLANRAAELAGQHRAFRFVRRLRRRNRFLIGGGSEGAVEATFDLERLEAARRAAMTRGFG